MSIKFKTTGYDEFIDFIKFYAIICVIFGHTFPLLDKIGYGIWAGMQVPLFVLVQSFHYLKKENVKINIRKILGRIVVPFLIAEVLTFTIAMFVKGESATTLFHDFIHQGGYGPGSYYPYIYLQIALLLPAFAILLKRFNKTTLLIIFLLISEGVEILFSLTNLPDIIYRLLAVRYIFLIYLAWLWVKDGITINKTTILLSILSLFAIIYFEYFNVNSEPWFYNTGWKSHRWPCYFFVSTSLIAILHHIWGGEYLRNNKFIIKTIKTIASSSYEIFLVQMSLIYLFTTKSIFFVSNIFIRYIMWLVIVWTVSIGGGILINRIINCKNDKHNK
ncbi:MAG: acyltransferase [Bacteroidales bacterium]|nr:acyltransferase [Bacteroidales bacterium]